MRLRIILASVVIFALVRLGHAQPVIVFEEESYDFGEAVQSETLEHTFVFKNTGTETLVIQKVTSS